MWAAHGRGQARPAEASSPSTDLELLGDPGLLPVHGVQDGGDDGAGAQEDELAQRGPPSALHGGAEWGRRRGPAVNPAPHLPHPGPHPRTALPGRPFPETPAGRPAMTYTGAGSGGGVKGAGRRSCQGDRRAAGSSGGSGHPFSRVRERLCRVERLPAARRPFPCDPRSRATTGAPARASVALVSGVTGLVDGLLDVSASRLGGGKRMERQALGTVRVYALGQPCELDCILSSLQTGRLRPGRLGMCSKPYG